MKKCLIIGLHLFLSSGLLAQEYIQFPELNATWTVEYEDWSTPSNPIYKTYQYFYNGDTIFNYHLDLIGDTIYQTDTCKKLFVRIHSSDGSPNFYEGPEGYIKTDNENKKVYYSNLNYLYTGLSLLYDFDLNTGDTLTGYITEQMLGDIITVSYIDSVFTGNAYHKQYNLNSEWMGALQSKLVEGVGSTTGLIWAYYSFERHSTLACLAVNNITIYPVYSEQPCDLVTTLGVAHNKAKINVYPTLIQGENTNIFMEHNNNNIKDVSIRNHYGQEIPCPIYSLNELANYVKVPEYLNNGFYYLIVNTEIQTFYYKIVIIK